MKLVGVALRGGEEEVATVVGDVAAEQELAVVPALVEDGVGGLRGAKGVEEDFVEVLGGL